MKNRFALTTLFMFLHASFAHAQVLGPPQGSVIEHEIAAPWMPPDTHAMPISTNCPKGYRFYGGVDYIAWWSRQDQPVQPVLIPYGESDGFLHSTLTDFGSLLHHGVRANLGTWLDPHQTLALELGGFWLGERTPSRQQEFHDYGNGEENNNGSESGFSSQFRSRINGAEANLRAEVCRGVWAHLDLIAGFRYFYLGETLELAGGEYEQPFLISYQFGTRNHFYGGQLGAQTEVHWKNLFINFWTKVALGVNCQNVNIAGSTFINGETQPGGVIAPAQTLGQFRRQEFAVLPEAGVNIGCQVSEHCRILAGYTFIFLDDTVRPGEVVNGLINSNNNVNGAIHLPTSTFWLQGLNGGIEFRF